MQFSERVESQNECASSEGESERIVERVAFLIHTPDIANHFEPIWRAMGAHAFDIILHGDIGLPFQVEGRYPCRVRRTEEVFDADQKYWCLVSPHIVATWNSALRKMPDGEVAPLPNALAIENLRMMYAAGKSGWNLADWNRYYDGVLCYGPYHARVFEEKFSIPTRQVGYPRFDAYFNEKPPLKPLLKSYGCDPKRKTVVWLPTWSTLSSVGHFDAEIAALSDRYNVVVKVHPLMPEDEPDRVERLRDLPFSAVITEAIDNLSLYRMADFMLFDYGGPPFAGIYTDKRFVLLNVPGAESDSIMGDTSPDLLLRQDVESVEVGQNRIASLLADRRVWRKHRKSLQRLRRLYFAPNFGTSASVAAAAILDRRWMQARKRISWSSG